MALTKLTRIWEMIKPYIILWISRTLIITRGFDESYAVEKNHLKFLPPHKIDTGYWVYGIGSRAETAEKWDFKTRKETPTKQQKHKQQNQIKEIIPVKNKTIK